MVANCVFADQPAAAQQLGQKTEAGEVEAKLTPQEEMQQLERERAEMLQSIRKATTDAAAERQNSIKANPELAALQTKISALQQELKAAREKLAAKMKEAGMNVETAPQKTLDGMARLREIDRRMRELMGQGATAPAVQPDEAQQK